MVNVPHWQVLLLLQDGAATVESYAGLQRTAASRLRTLGTLEKSLEPQKHHVMSWKTEKQHSDDCCFFQVVDRVFMFFGHTEFDRQEHTMNHDVQ